MAEADVLLVVGPSLQVDPAAGLVFEARRIVVNPDVPDRASGPGFEVVAEPATVGVPEVVAGLLREAGPRVASGNAVDSSCMTFPAMHFSGSKA